MPISFFSIDVKLKLDSRRKLKSFLRQIVVGYGFELQSLNVVFCSDQYLLQLNKQFLDHDTYTDIITFPLSEPHEPIKAEIYISLDRITANALTFEVSPKLELHRVIIHGVLHLCGFGDKSAAEKKTMKDLEDYNLHTYFPGNVSREI